MPSEVAQKIYELNFDTLLQLFIHKFPDIMSIPRLPDNIYHAILPSSNLSVHALTLFPIPSTKNQLDTLSKPVFSRSKSMINNPSTAKVLTSLSMPPYSVLEELQQNIIEAAKNDYASFLYPLPTGSDLHLSFWVLEYWYAAYEVHESKERWLRAIAWLQHQNEANTVELLKTIPWSATLPRRMGPQGSESIRLLADYCSTTWLSSTHMDQLSTILEYTFKRADISAIAPDTTFLKGIITAYHYNKNGYSTQTSTSEARCIGSLLTSNTCLQISVNISIRLEDNVAYLPHGDYKGNHWVAMIINVENITLHYADPWGAPPPDELLEIVNWWLGIHLSARFTLENLPCTIQEDTYSCAVLSYNAAAHFFFPERVPLIPADMAMLARVDLMRGIIKFLSDTVSCL